MTMELDRRYQGDLSINMLHGILKVKERKVEEGKSKYIGAQQKELRNKIQTRIKDAAQPRTIQNLGILSAHSTSARHGGSQAYTIQRLNQFARDVELDKPNGWIFRWLGNLPNSRGECQPHFVKQARCVGEADKSTPPKPPERQTGSGDGAQNRQHDLDAESWLVFVPLQFS